MTPIHDEAETAAASDLTVVQSGFAAHAMTLSPLRS
jgi:hypothetical protein